MRLAAAAIKAGADEMPDVEFDDTDVAELP